jgi:sugar phosphate isomerase/epimerase
MIYPKSLMDPDYHVRTLEALAAREDIETLDCCLPYGAEHQQRLVEAIRSSGKSDVAYALHLFPARKLWPSTRVPHEQAQIRILIHDMVEQAAAIGATGLVFASGGPPHGSASQEDFAGFADFCRWLSQELKPHGITAMLEPADAEIDKRFLYGPTASCVKLIESLKPDVDNLTLLVDLAHAPLLGESARQAIVGSLPYLGRVHVGNCVLKDPQHPLYGDRHPPIGAPGGEIDTPQIVEILRCLLEVGYLSKKQRGCLLIEMLPWPGMSPEETIVEQVGRLHEAWRSL